MRASDGCQPPSARQYSTRAMYAVPMPSLTPSICTLRTSSLVPSAALTPTVKRGSTSVCPTSSARPLAQTRVSPCSCAAYNSSMTSISPPSGRRAQLMNASVTAPPCVRYGSTVIAHSGSSLSA